MFHQGTEVGCCAIMHEEWKRGSKEASSKGNKQRQTGVCLPDAWLNLSRRRSNRHPRTPTNITHSQQMVTWLLCTRALSIVCVCVCLSARKCLCQGADHSRHGPKQGCVSARRTQRDRHRARQRSGVDGAVRKDRKSRGKEERTNDGTGLYSC